VISGAASAAVDWIHIAVEGKGSHAARPHLAVDTVLVAAHMIAAVQSIAARNIDPLASAVISLCHVDAGSAFNVIPQTAQLRGTVRTLSKAVQDLVEARLHRVVAGVAATFGATATLNYDRACPSVLNTGAECDHAARAAASVLGEAGVWRDVDPAMGGEDFAFMLEERPGCMIGIGQGGAFGLHHPSYDFNDAILPIGMSYWAKLVETRLPS